MVSLPIQRLSDSGAAGNPLRRCLFHPVTFHAVSSAAATLSQHPTQHNTSQPLWPHTNQPNLCVVPSGSSPMSHLMGRSNRQGDSSTGGTPVLFCFHHIELPVAGCISPSPPPPSPTDSAWHGSPGFHELKAKVTEVPAPEISQDNTGLHHTPVAHHHHRFSAPFRQQGAKNNSKLFYS